MSLAAWTLLLALVALGVALVAFAVTRESRGPKSPEDTFPHKEMRP